MGENWGNDSKTLLSYSRFGSSHQEGLFYRKQSGSAGSQAPHQQAGAIKELGSLILQVSSASLAASLTDLAYRG